MAIRSLIPDLWRGGGISNPVREMSRLQRRLDRMFDDFFQEPMQSTMTSGRGLWEPSMTEAYAPACDIEETANQYLVSFDLPGIKKEDIQIELTDNYLTISGERKKEHREQEKGRVAQERYYGTFTRSFTLPSNVSADRVEASYDNGVLQISIPKMAATAGKRIPVKEAKLIESKAGKVA